MNNSQAVNLMNGFISDLSDAAMEVLKEAQVLFTVLLFSCIQVVQCLNKFASWLDLDVKGVKGKGSRTSAMQVVASLHGWGEVLPLAPGC